ncbi:MAG: polymer-forming cytoskeletal protein [Fibrobacterota bacterium]
MGEKNYSGNLLTMIGAGAKFDGSIEADHDIRIDGFVKGSVKSSGELTIGSEGCVQADVEVKSAKISGEVNGNLHVSEMVELEEKASLVGDIKTKNLIINEGAVFHGNCKMQNEE